MNKGTNTKILNKTYILFTILLLLIPTVVAINYPQLTGYVTDNANIITPEYKQKITDLAERINKNTTVEIAVLTIESLEGDSPENYAVQTFRQNGVGKKDNNNGRFVCNVFVLSRMQQPNCKVYFEMSWTKKFISMFYA